MTPDQLRAEFELAVAADPEEPRPDLTRTESGAYQRTWTAVEFRGFCRAFRHFCAGEAVEPGQPK